MTPAEIRAIPDELRQADRWLVWRLVAREDRPTKVPVHPLTGHPVDGTDPAAWMTFDEALLYADRHDGLGFALGETPYTGIDLDRCIDDRRVIAPWALAIVRRLDSYTEWTPSGRGLRIWVRGKLPPGRRRQGPIEMYDTGRFFTVTGRHLEGTPGVIEERSVELSELHSELFPPKLKMISERPVPAPPDLSDDVLLTKAFASKNGAAILALYQGDTSAYGGDDSSADCALCAHLAFWFGGDVEAIDRVFRTSGLYREKWDRADYREKTIAKALDGSSFYNPFHVQLRRGGQVNGQGAPATIRLSGEDDTQQSAARFHRTDLGNARRLVALHGDDIRFCHPWSRWLHWSGDRWDLDETGLIYRHARDVVGQIHREAAAAEDDGVRTALARWALTCEGERKINAMVSLARQEPGVPILPGQLDSWPWLLNCPNGTLDLRTGRLGPHVRGDHLTRRTNAPFDLEADCPTWSKFLARVMADDLDLIGFLRRVVGYALTGDVSEHAIFFLYGRGRNGKSTFLNTLQWVLGDYAITINADLLTAKNQDEHPTGVADLQGRRFVATIEVEDGRRMAEALVKTLTGEDRIRARRMRQDFFEFDPTHKLFLAANHKPTVRGTDEGIWRRIKLIPFAVQIPLDEVDRALPERLRREAPGILAWAVRGCLEWQSSGLSEPSAVTEATADYRAEMDVLSDFLDLCCLLDPGVRSKAGALYHAYAGWCKDTGNFALSMNKFGRLLTERGFPSEKSNSQTWRLGLGLKRNEEEGESVPYF